jgi:hypothetical protein
MPKEPATALGMTFRLMSVATIITVVGHLLIVPTVSLTVWAVITAAILSPAVAIATYQQIRLRRKLAREKSS